MRLLCEHHLFRFYRFHQEGSMLTIHAITFNLHVCLVPTPSSMFCQIETTKQTHKNWKIFFIAKNIVKIVPKVYIFSLTLYANDKFNFYRVLKVSIDCQQNNLRSSRFGFAVKSCCFAAKMLFSQAQYNFSNAQSVFERAFCIVLLFQSRNFRLKSVFYAF